jgi:hypothetical protein
MAITSTSLSKMTGSDGSGASSGLLMPKLQYRFRVTFQNFGGQADSKELTKQVVDFTRPSVEFAEIPIEVYNSRIYLAGKPTWQAVTLNVRDDAQGSVAGLVGAQLQRQFDFAEQASAAAGADYKFNMSCDILDGASGAGTPGVLESWSLLGCYLASANYNQLSYSANEPATIALSIRFDNAVQEKEGSQSFGVGLGKTMAAGVAGTITNG